MYRLGNVRGPGTDDFANLPTSREEMTITRIEVIFSDKMHGSIRCQSSSLFSLLVTCYFVAALPTQQGLYQAIEHLFFSPDFHENTCTELRVYLLHPRHF
jgi:hypothetical protein